MANPITHFEIHASEPERAITFYSKVFAWDIRKWEGGQMEYWVIMISKVGEPGINGGLLRRHGAAPTEGQAVNAFVSTIVVEDYDATEAKILDNGGTLAVAKMPLVGMAWQGYYKDTEGNLFGLHQTDPNAK